MRQRIHFSYGLLTLPLIVLLAYGNQFLFLAGNEFSDLLISHLPNALFLRRALLEWGQVPLWSSGILSGFPFAANPLSGLFYPPGWLAVLLPEAWMFNLLAGLHLGWGGLGVVTLLRRQGLGQVAALFGGLAFALMPKLFAHYGAGHITLIYAVAWTPWLLYSSSSMWDERRSVRLWPALILAVIFFADVRWAAFAGLLWAGWWLTVKWQGNACSQINLRGVWHNKAGGDVLIDAGALTDADVPPSRDTPPAGEPGSSTTPRLGWGGWVRVSNLGFQLLLAVGLCAPLAFPLIEFIGLSTRAALGATDVLAFSLPPARLLGFLFPEMGGMQEWVVYSGLLNLALALMGGAEVRRKTRFWWGVWLIAVVFSLGEYLPGLSLLANVPGVNLLRVPSRALFLAGLALAMLAAFSLDDLLIGLKAADRRRAMRVLVVLCGGTVALAGCVWALTGALSRNFVWGAGMAGLTLVVLGWVIGARRPLPGWVGLLLIGISVLDLGGVNVRSLSPRPAQEIVSEQAEVVTFLAAQDGLFRVYSPSYSLPQHVAAQNKFELADGVDPMQIAEYVAFMARASGVPQTGYSVTVPPFVGEVATTNQEYVPDAVLLGRLNVRFVVAEFEVEAVGLTLVQQFGRTRVYENTLARTRAWVEDALGARPVSVTWTPNRLEAEASGPGRLVLSELAYPGWQVWVDGQRAPLLNVDGLFRGVDLSTGSHRVIFAFRPMSLYGGGGLFGIAVGFLVIRRFRKRDDG